MYALALTTLGILAAEDHTAEEEQQLPSSDQLFQPSELKGIEPETLIDTGTFKYPRLMPPLTRYLKVYK
jgi:hypothetical protein